MAEEIEMWAIMDKAKQAIACGSPRNRSMRMLTSVKTKKVRILLYGTEGMARAGFSGGVGFFDETYQEGDSPHPTYLRKTYKDEQGQNYYESVCIPVKVRIVIDE